MILTKTDFGQQAFKERSSLLPIRLRSVFILFDGKRSLGDIMRSALTMGVDETDIQRMMDHGLLEATASASTEVQEIAEPGFFETLGAASHTSSRSAQQRYTDAYPIALQLTSRLGLRGFRLNLAVEAASGYEQMLALAPQILKAVGPEKFLPLERALKH